MNTLPVGIIFDEGGFTSRTKLCHCIITALAHHWPRNMRAKSARECPANALPRAVLWSPEWTQPFTEVFRVRL